MAVSGSTGCKLYIGGQGALGSESGWQEVGEVENLGSFGDTRQIIRFLSLGDARVRKTKGTADSGDLALVVGFDAFDAGQLELRDASDDTSSNPYNFRIDLNDAPAVSGATVTQVTFQALVNGFQFNVGSADQTVTANVTLAITTALTVVDAAS